MYRRTRHSLRNNSQGQDGGGQAPLGIAPAPALAPQQNLTPTTAEALEHPLPNFQPFKAKNKKFLYEQTPPEAKG